MARYNDSALPQTRAVATGGTGRTTLTPYGLMMGDGTNSIKQLGTGTTGQTPVSGGATSDFVWSNPKNISAFQLITQQVISTSTATVDFTNLGTDFVAFRLVVDSWDVASNSSMNMRFSINNG